MSKYEEQAEIIGKTLGLQWGPIAIKFANSPVEKSESRKLPVCKAFDAVRRENVVLSLSKENCPCPGGKHTMGFESLPLDRVADVWVKAHRAYENSEVALASIKKQPQPVKRGEFMTIAQLGKATADPDVVLFFVNAAQADRITGLVSFGGAEPFMYYPVTNICSSVSNCLAKGRPDINFLAAHERHGSSWSPNELIVTLPYTQFEGAIKNIPNSVYGTAEPVSPRPAGG